MQLEDRLYASSEVARILGVSRRTLYRYLESGTLGSMHLPSGRHRFTKDQVEAFLVKTYGASSLKTEPILETKKAEPKKIEVEEKEIIEEIKNVERPSIFSKVKAQLEEEDLPEEIIEKDIEEVVKVDENVDEEVDEVVEDLKKTLSSLFDDNEEQEQKEELVKIEKKDKNNFIFYSSSISDLKKLAKTVKVASENSNVQYAFTGQAGASLYGEVSPFGQLHLYIRKNDMLFFEKRFDLQVTDEESSNVALKIVDELPEHTIVMGFKVVNLPTLKADLVQLGDSATAGNLEG